MRFRSWEHLGTNRNNSYLLPFKMWDICRSGSAISGELFSSWISCFVEESMGGWAAVFLLSGDVRKNCASICCARCLRLLSMIWLYTSVTIFACACPVSPSQSARIGRCKNCLSQIQRKFWFTTVSQYTAIDEFTRLHFLAAYEELSIYYFIDFLRKLTA